MRLPPVRTSISFAILLAVVGLIVDDRQDDPHGAAFFRFIDCVAGGHVQRVLRGSTGF